MSDDKSKSFSDLKKDLDEAIEKGDSIESTAAQEEIIKTAKDALKTIATLSQGLYQACHDQLAIPDEAKMDDANVTDAAARFIGYRELLLRNLKPTDIEIKMKEVVGILVEQQNQAIKLGERLEKLEEYTY